MRVCLLNDSFPPVIDGVVNVVMNYANYLQQNHGTEVIVGTPAYPDADYSAYSYPVVPYPSLDTAAVASGYRTGNPFSGKAFGKLTDFQPDILHAHCPASSTIIARLLREKTGAPVVFTYHTRYEIDIRRVVKARPVAEEGIRAMIGNISACDEVWVVSRGAGESLTSLGYEGSWRVMNNGVDFARGRVPEPEVARVTGGYDLPEGVPVYLFVGRLMTYKGLPLILDALKTVHEAGQDFRMVFVGKGPDRDLLMGQAEKNGIAGKCIFTGPVYDRDALRAWNTRADLFLFPSTFDTNGLVVREAAACGLASVLVRDSCASEGITDGRNGFLIEETAESLAALLQKTGQNLDLLHRVGMRAMEEIYLSWSDCVDAAYARYLDILEKKALGAYAGKKRDPADLLVSATAWTMGGQEKIRRLGHEVFGDFRETAVGMMENIQEFGENAEQLGRKTAGQIKSGFEERKRELKEGAEQLKEDFRAYGRGLEAEEQFHLNVVEEALKELGGNRKE